MEVLRATNIKKVFTSKSISPARKYIIQDGKMLKKRVVTLGFHESKVKQDSSSKVKP